MKNIWTLLLLLCLPLWTRAQCDEELSRGVQQYVLVWHDEFNVDGAPNPQDWNIEEGFSGQREMQWYQPQNVWCRNGVLTITARRENRPNPNYNSKSNDWKNLRKSIYMSSGAINTQGKHEFLFGRIEVRARIPAYPGTWPSIWMKGDKYPWPSCGEIDLMEFYPHSGTPSLLANVCWAGYEDTSNWDASVFPIEKFMAKDPQWTSKFHVWRLDWDRYFIRIYLDDELIKTTSLTNTINAPSSMGANDNPFESPLHIAFNMAMGGNGGYIADETLPAHFEIDYVRVYQRL